MTCWRLAQGFGLSSPTGRYTEPNLSKKLQQPKIKNKIIKVSIQVGGKKFTLNCHSALYGKYRVKRGRSWSKTGLLSLTEIFEKSRKWAVAQGR